MSAPCTDTLLMSPPTPHSPQLTVQANMVMPFTTLLSGRRSRRSLMSRPLAESRHLLASVVGFETDFAYSLSVLLGIVTSSVNVTSLTGTSTSAVVIFTVSGR